MIVSYHTLNSAQNLPVNLFHFHSNIEGPQTFERIRIGLGWKFAANADWFDFPSRLKPSPSGHLAGTPDGLLLR